MNSDRAATRELLRLEVYCVNKDHGCSETMKWADLAKHRETCSYRMVQCTNPGCTKAVFTTELQNHLNDCGFTAEHCEICGEDISHNDMLSGHVEICKSKPQKCPLSALGCQFEGSVETHQDHLLTKIEDHSRKIASKLQDHSATQKHLTVQFSEMQTNIKHLQNLTDSLKPKSPREKEIQLIQKSVAKLNVDVNTLKETMHTHAKNSDLQTCADQIQSVRQIATTQESRITHLEQGTNGHGSTRDLLEKVSRIETTVGMHDVRIAETDLRFRLLETAAFNGRLIWRIPNYSRRKQDAMEGRTVSLYSQPFYSSYYGYKMCARVYLNGDGLGNGTHLSLFFVIMRGEYDPLQAWPFRHKVTLSLLDQSGSRKHIADTFRPDPSSSSFRKPVGEMNIASGSPMFAPHSKVESPSYLVDDTLFICVSIDKTDLLEPWF